MSVMKNEVFNLYKETEILKQCFKSNDLNYFAKHSQARDFLAQLGKGSAVVFWKLRFSYNFCFMTKFKLKE